MSREELTAKRLRELTAPYGFDAVSAAPVESAPLRERAYRRWIEAGRQGGMAYLAHHADLKYRPAELLRGAQSMIVVAVSYYRPRTQPEPPADQGLIARYAWGRDYHKPLKKRLQALAKDLRAAFPGAQLRPFVDTAPLDERYYAARAGLGFQGRNHSLILPGGSWYVLGELLCDVPVAWSSFALPAEAPRFASGCPSGCRRCIEHCPTGALGRDGSFDARLCISYLTIEHRREIPEHLRGRIGNRLFGCDTCQEVCPLNRAPAETGEEDFRREIAGERQELAPLLRLGGREAMVARFAGSPVLRASRERLLANAAIVAANNGAASLRPLIRRLEQEEDPGLRSQAAWALRRLPGNPAVE